MIFMVHILLKHFVCYSLFLLADNGGYSDRGRGGGRGRSRGYRSMFLCLSNCESVTYYCTLLDIDRWFGIYSEELILW